MVELGRNWVRTTVIDDATGEPVPCRIHFRSHSGVPYQPHGHQDHLTGDLDAWHIDVGGDLRPGPASYAPNGGTCPGGLAPGDGGADSAPWTEDQPPRTPGATRPRPPGRRPPLKPSS